MTTASPTTLVDFLLARLGELAAESVAHRESVKVLERATGWKSSFSSRVFADVASKRRIIAECVDCTSRPDDDPTCDGLAHFVLRLLALVYAEHPDYRAEWRP